jgi:glycine betaine/proline transport system substrate-binding protein
MRKTFLGIVGAVTGLAMMPATATTAHACGEVTITEMNWASSQVVTAVSKFLMEQGYGCDVTKVPSATVTAATSLVETGKPDIATELWLNGAPAVRKLVEGGKAVDAGKVLSDGGVEGWYVPQYLVDKHPELAKIDGILANPKLVGGRFHQCPDGWGCKITNESLVNALKVEDKMEVFVHGSGETLATSIASAFEGKEPWFGYYWAPTDVLGKYDMVRVDIGPVDEEIHKCNADKDCEKDGISQYPSSPVHTIVTKDFAERQPEILALMKNVSFTNKQMGQVLAWKKENKASADEAAVYFLNNYKDTWSKWINDDAKEKLAALLK